MTAIDKPTNQTRARTSTRARTAAWPLVRRAFAYELGMWRSLFRWVLRRPVAGPGAEAFRYAAVLTPVYLAFIGVSAIEIPVMHLLLPWEGVRRVVDVLGAYGLLWMVGMLASVRVHPHVVSDPGLRVRHGISVDTTIPWGAIATISARQRSVPTRRAVKLYQTEAGLAAHIAILGQTNVDIVLRQPTTLALPRGDGEPIIELRLYADDPGALVARARRHLTADQ